VIIQMRIDCKRTSSDTGHELRVLD
jgi:hypothetical protein